MVKLPVLAGNLSMKPLHGLFASWQLRYFRLSNGCLSWFASVNDTASKGSLIIDETCTTHNAGDTHKKKFCWEVRCWRGSLALCAECEEEFQLWKAHINLTVSSIIHIAADKGIKRGEVAKKDRSWISGKWRPRWAVLSGALLCLYETPDDPSRQVTFWCFPRARITCTKHVG
jgi:hypothetical protein